ncbi:MAG TPA: carboxymuconolactone decarboxylase family protein [Casimicrobiaceae bacterium]
MDASASHHFHEITKGVSHNLAYLRAELPDVLKSFNDLGKAASKGGALDEKTKELIAVALAVASHCDACIGFHVRSLVRLGGSKRELAEALGMAVYMGGGPSLMYAANALAAMDEFSATAAPAPAAA